jgi:predicted RecA/RadA family phage recombinase
MSTGSVHGFTEASFVAGGAIIEKSPVKLDSTVNQVVQAAAVTDSVIGYAQNSAASGATVTVRLAGVTLAKIGTGGVAIGNKVTPDTGGVVIATTTASDLVCGVALNAASANEYAEVLMIAPSQDYASLV